MSVREKHNNFLFLLYPCMYKSIANLKRGFESATDTYAYGRRLFNLKLEIICKKYTKYLIDREIFSSLSIITNVCYIIGNINLERSGSFCNPHSHATGFQALITWGIYLFPFGTSFIFKD